MVDVLVPPGRCPYWNCWVPLPCPDPEHAPGSGAGPDPCGSCGRLVKIHGQGLCHDCYTRKWRAENREKINAWDREWSSRKRREAGVPQRGPYRPRAGK
jgi:hypothetical protein